ncbi:M1 family metallopeptidase [Rhodanobacter sp. BL-MT-08]
MRSAAVGSMVVCAWVVAGAAGVVTDTVHAESIAAAASVASPASAAPAAPAATAIKPAADDPADIPFASAHAAGTSTPSTTNAWGGERTGGQATLSDRVVSYWINADLDAVKHAVAGSEHMTWRNRSDRAVSRVYFHLYLNGFKNNGSTWFTERKVLTAHGQSRGAASLEKGQWGWIDLKQVKQGSTSLAWHYVQPDGGPATDQSVACIELAQPIPAGGTLTLDIDFLSQLPRVVERTGWWGDFNLVGQWFPKIGVLELAGERGATAPRWNVHEFHFNSEFYADFGSFDVHLTAPSDYTVGAVGKLADQPTQAQGKTTYHFVQGDVHDFAWVAAKGYKTLDGTWQGPGSPKVAVRVIYPAEYAASAAPTLKSTIDSLGYFSRTLGAYPYETITAVVPPYNASEAGGMEYPTFFTSEGYKEIVPGTLNEYMSDFVNIHEFGHGYFYGLLASNEFEEPMLDEGMNEYWDDRMMRERNEDVVLATPLMKRLGVAPAMSGFMLDRLGAGLKQPADPLSQNSWDRLSSSSYNTVYSRTATAMHDLEERLGKSVMERAMRLYYQRWRFRHPSSADLRAALIDGSGDAKDVNAIFDQYVYGTAHIDDSVTDIDVAEVLPDAGVVATNGKPVESDQDALDKQITKQRTAWKKSHPKPAFDDEGPFPWRSTVTVFRDGASLPQLLRVTFADGTHQDVRWNDDRRWARFDFVKPGKVVSAELDSPQLVYLDANKLNDSLTTKPNGAASRRWAADFAAALEAFYAALVTL